METMIRIEGQLAPCECGSQPSFYQGAGGVHAECSRCRVRLWVRPTLQESVADWERVQNKGENNG